MVALARPVVIAVQMNVPQSCPRRNALSTRSEASSVIGGCGLPAEGFERVGLDLPIGVVPRMVRMCLFAL